MGFFSHTQPEEEYSAPIPEPEKPAVSQMPAHDSVLGQGQTLKGEMTGKGTVRIDGTVRGKIVLEGSVSVSRPGRVFGSIQANNVFLSGKMEGTIIARGKLCLTATCDFTGDIQAGLLLVEEGARFNGTSKMLAPSAPVREEDSFPSSEALRFGENYSLEMEDEEDQG